MPGNFNGGRLIFYLYTYKINLSLITLPMKMKSLRSHFRLTTLTILLFSTVAVAQVGINTTEPSTVLDVDGALSLREAPQPLTLESGLNRRVELGAIPYSQYLIEGPSASFSISSIVPVGTQADGQILRLINTTPHNMTIRQGGGIGSSSLEILCPGGTNLVLGGVNSSVTLQYSKGLSRWNGGGLCCEANYG